MSGLVTWIVYDIFVPGIAAATPIFVTPIGFCAYSKPGAATATISTAKQRKRDMGLSPSAVYLLSMARDAISKSRAGGRSVMMPNPPFASKPNQHKDGSNRHQ